MYRRRCRQDCAASPGPSRTISARARSQNPMAIGVAHPERMVDSFGHVRRRAFSVRERDLRRAGERARCAEGEKGSLRLHAEHVVHRIRPIDVAAGEIPIPKSAAAPIEGRIDPVANAIAENIGLTCPSRLPEVGRSDGQKHDDRGYECRGHSEKHHRANQPARRSSDAQKRSGRTALATYAQSPVHPCRRRDGHAEHHRVPPDSSTTARCRDNRLARPPW